jgi:DNA repair protein REV1
MATHIIAAALPPKKVVDYNKYRMVKPAWVTDSIKAGKILPWSDYRIFDEGPGQKTIRFDGGKMLNKTSQQSQLRYREQTQNSFYTSQLQKSSASRSSLSIEQTHSSEDTSQGDGEDGDAMNRDPQDMEGLTIGSPTDQIPALCEEDVVEAGEGDQLEANTESDTAEKLELPAIPSSAKPMTSEEHNALLLSDPRIRKSSTANPDFLKQFYSESRLHHLSTWKAELKSKMQRLAAEKGLSSRGAKRSVGVRRYIMHVDFDSFFCAVSLKKHPDYVDKPAVVAHSTGSGSEIASCNYPAREFGLKNGMWMKRAHELCPDLKVLPYDFPAYEEASGLFYSAILEVGGIVQSVSIDEALVDITDIVLSATDSTGQAISEDSIWREQETADVVALTLRTQIKEKTGCNVSVGIGGNILLAKVALRKAKPAGQYQIMPEEVLDIVGDLAVENLPGVAYSIGGKLEEVGIKLVKDIRQSSKERLVAVLGPKTGERLWEYSRGIDRVEVGEQPIRKSVSAEVNWGIRFINQQEAEDFVGNLSKELERRLLNEGVKGKHLTMKIMRRSTDAPLDPPKHLGHGKCDTFNKSAVFGVATNSGELIGKEAVIILRSFKFSPGDLRGIGVQLTKLEPIKSTTNAPEGSQKRLNFGSFATAHSAKKAATETIDDEEAPDMAKPRSSREEDPISDDQLTPRKPRVHPALALAKASAMDESARTPLNMTGTQFIMPSNPDPAVLAELPSDIRSKLMGMTPSRQLSPHVKSRPESPALSDDMPSDIDPEVFEALPDDMKAEVLASYGRRKGQSMLPQSPHKNRVIAQPKKATTPTKRGIRGMFHRARERQQDADARLQQTNFLPATKPGLETEADLTDVEDLDQDFLAQLPEDVRREVIDDHRRQRLAQKSGLDIQAPMRRLPLPGDWDGSLPGGQTKLHFEPVPPRISFTHSSLSSIAEIKDMLSAWHRETKDDGPHRADVEVLEKYLARVIIEERDMDKVRKLVQWLEWVADEEAGDAKGRLKWIKALASVRMAVQEAMKKRGLGPMHLD